MKRLIGLGLLVALGGSACMQTTSNARRSKKHKVSKSKSQAAQAGDLQEEEPSVFPTAPLPSYARLPGKTGNVYLDRFADLWSDVHDTKNGYFSPEGVPYHSAETLLVEAPDYGHETTSEAYSYWIWLEAAYGRVTGDWKPLEQSWKSMETYIIPTKEDQPTAGSYNFTHPAVFSPELDDPRQYPSPMENGATPGWDPLWKELLATYTEPYVYGMHWLLDVDNFYGYGRRSDGVSKPSYMNTFQRGMQESVWETIPQPSWDSFNWGGDSGYLDLFVRQNGGYTKQWKYTNAPDADARAIQALYWAKTWADDKGGNPAVDALAKKSAKMGDFLRYSLFDKYFKALGCTSPNCPPAEGRESAHYLISWYYAWGGSLSKKGGWSWRIGSSTSHQGYQNPFAAYVMSHVDAFKAASKTAASDWGTSLDRQLEVLRFLQSSEGAIAGGVTNSWMGRYAQPPAGTTMFYKMPYVEKPVWEDPPSNQWFGFQVWGIERSAALYWLTGDEKAKIILDKWVAWATAHTRLLANGSYEIPSTLLWEGQPGKNWDKEHQNWNGADKKFNEGLHVKVVDYTQDVGVTSTYARTLIYYGAKSGRHDISKIGQELLDRMWKLYRSPKGISNPETRGDYKRFNESAVVPSSFKGKMPNGDVIDSNSTFLSIRTKIKQDPDWPKVQAFLSGGPPPEFHYHRFWAQADIALSNATMAWLYPQGIPTKKATAPAKTPAAKAKGKPAAKAGAAK